MLVMDIRQACTNDKRLTDEWSWGTVGLTACACPSTTVSDADGSEGGFQLKKEHALRVLGYISSWTQR